MVAKVQRYRQTIAWHQAVYRVANGDVAGAFYYQEFFQFFSVCFGRCAVFQPHYGGYALLVHAYNVCIGIFGSIMFLQVGTV